MNQYNILFIIFGPLFVEEGFFSSSVCEIKLVKLTSAVHLLSHMINMIIYYFWNFVCCGRILVVVVMCVYVCVCVK